MRIKNRVKLYKDRDLSRIEVFSGDDRKYDESISFLLKCLCRAAKGNNVFVAYFGNNPELEAPDNAIEIKAWKEGSPHKMLWMRETWLSLTNKKFTEEFYSSVYIFDRAFTWESFLRTEISNLNVRHYIRSQQLLLNADFGDCSAPILYMKPGSAAETESIQYFRNKGYEIKRANLFNRPFV